MFRHDICPLCASSEVSHYLRCTDHLITGEEFELFRCSECGFVFTREYPDSTSIGSYYESDDYISHSDNPKGFMNRIYLVVREIMLFRKRNLVLKATGLKKGNILDIGCGTGYFAGIMKKSGWDVKGIEPSKKAREYGSQRFGIEVLSPEKISAIPDKSFDCITMWHVLEHLHDPFNYVREISRLLKDNGICITASPNSDSYDASYYQSYWAAYDVPRHLWHFSAGTLKVLAGKTDFRISGIRSLPFDVFYISILSERNKGNSLSIIRGLFRGFLFAVGSMFNIRKSSSLVYLLERK